MYDACSMYMIVLYMICLCDAKHQEGHFLATVSSSVRIGIGLSDWSVKVWDIAAGKQLVDPAASFFWGGGATINAKCIGHSQS